MESLGIAAPVSKIEPSARSPRSGACSGNLVFFLVNSAERGSSGLARALGRIQSKRVRFWWRWTGNSRD